MNKKEYNKLLKLSKATMIIEAERLYPASMKYFDLVVIKGNDSLEVIKNRFKGETGYIINK